MKQNIKDYDSGLIELRSDGGTVLIAPGLQGRIFCQVGDELIHRFDPAPLNPIKPGEFRNLGGNSLWPAPEGGPYAFNYLPNSDTWLVQEGINDTNYRVVSQSSGKAVIQKEIILTNRKGVNVRARFSRSISTVNATERVAGFDVQAVSYTCEDVITPLESYKKDGVLIAPWSLEQFPDCEGVIAFVKVPKADESVNADFYGSPADRISYRGGFFTFALGGGERLQIGIKAASRPEFIGALDSARCLLILRTTPPQSGIYFNIADNAQPQGPFSAADMYSIFNGGPLGFYELETIASMQVEGMSVAPGKLVSETLILRGDVSELKRFLKSRGITRV
ncbi:MAG: hypothetical protein PHR77_03435 [Kiritimatiellae bacterium]|nr:hypothetical protein [Kiritimatiellia bacterium]MDD5519658.1 hypothetical protein [Kiritimatiellia bacterium]